MQFIILGHLNDKFDGMSDQDKKTGMEGEWAKSREYYAKGFLKQIWLIEKENTIFSVFDVESRDRMEQLLADYPGIKAGFVTAEIKEAGPYHGFFPELA